MAADLGTKMSGSFSLIELLEITEQVLKEMLNCDYSFNIQINTDLKMIHENESNYFVIRCTEYADEIVELSFVYQHPISGYEDSEEDGWWSYATIRAASNSPIKYALAAASIVALSQLHRNVIIDENQIWTDLRIQTGSALLEKLRATERYDNYDAALQRFLEKIHIYEER